jgi:hypothetical protein
LPSIFQLLIGWAAVLMATSTGSRLMLVVVLVFPQRQFVLISDVSSANNIKQSNSSHPALLAGSGYYLDEVPTLNLLGSEFIQTLFFIPTVYKSWTRSALLKGTSQFSP